MTETPAAWATLISPYTVLIAAIVTGLITWRVATIQHKRAPEHRLIGLLQDQVKDDAVRIQTMQERMDGQDERLRAQDTRLDALDDDLRRSREVEALLRLHVTALEAHINAGSPPPPPRPPVGLTLQD